MAYTPPLSDPNSPSYGRGDAAALTARQQTFPAPSGAAPPGYSWDGAQGRWVPTVASAANALGLQTQLFGGSSALSGNSSSSGSGGRPTIPPPSLTGLSAAAGPGASAGAGAGPPTSGGGSSSPSGTAHLAPVDTSAAEGASFAKAKDQVGQEASGALTGLRSALGSRGMLGSGLEERGTAAAATSAAGELGDVSRQAAVTKADLAQKNAETNLTAGVTQRGQDFQKEEAGNTLAGNLAMAGSANAVTQRGQDITAASDQQRYSLGQAQLVIQQHATSLAGLEAALKATTPTAGAY